jgi:hypothetical protein
MSGVDMSDGRQDMSIITAITRLVVRTEIIGDSGLFGLDSSLRWNDRPGQYCKPIVLLHPKWSAACSAERGDLGASLRECILPLLRQERSSCH